MIYKEELKRLIRELNERKTGLMKEQSRLPDGYLQIGRHGDDEYYTLRLPAKGNRKKMKQLGITNNKEVLFGLVRKRYITKALKIIDDDLSVLTKAAERYREFDELSVMKDFLEEHPKLTAAIQRDSKTDEEWAGNYVRKKDFYESDLTSLASDGTPMRSRGEVVIAEKLKHYGIPYKYEFDISTEIPDLPYVPDFVIRRPRDGKVFFWEHFGEVNNEQYMRDNKRKLDDYELYGIVPWSNLIITYDTVDGGVNAPLIEAMIHAWLL